MACTSSYIPFQFIVVHDTLRLIKHSMPGMDANMHTPYGWYAPHLDSA